MSLLTSTRRPVILYALPVIIVGSIIALCTIGRYLRRYHHWDSFRRYGNRNRPAFDIDRAQPAQLPTVLPSPYYLNQPGAQYQQTPISQPPPIHQLQYGRASRTLPVTVPASAAPTVTPFVPSAAPTEVGIGQYGIGNPTSFNSDAGNPGGRTEAVGPGAGPTRGATPPPPSYDAVWRNQA